MSDADFSDVIRAVKLFDDNDRPWAVCGGWAIDLYLNRVTRLHNDIDFTVLRNDQLIIQKYLLTRGRSLEKAVSGQLIPWEVGEWIDLPVHTVWCKNPLAMLDFSPERRVWLATALRKLHPDHVWLRNLSRKMKESL